MEKTGNILRAIFDSNDDVWFFVAPDYSIQFFNNKALENSLVYHQKQLKAGDNILDYAKDTKNTIDQTFVKNFKKAVNGQIVKEEQEIQYGTSSIWTRSKFIPVYEAGILLGISLTVEDITREKLMEQDQIKFQEEIIMLSNKREEFLNIASHELKTPLSSLKASVQIIENLIANDSNLNVKPFIKKANISIIKLTKLINDLLDINKIERGELPLEKSVFTLSELINSCCEYLRTEGHYKIKLLGNLDLQVYADKDKIDQVVVNLVNNAAKYAPKSKDIIITIHEDPAYTRVSVQDFGPGIPPEKAKKIFQRYYRASNSKEYQSGMGLGLYISEEIIRRHHGEIGVNTAPGQGCTFWFTLPV